MSLFVSALLSPLCSCAKDQGVQTRSDSSSAAAKADAEHWEWGLLFYKGFELLERFIWTKHPLWEELRFCGVDSTRMGRTRKHMFTHIIQTHKAEMSYHISLIMFIYIQWQTKLA